MGDCPSSRRKDTRSRGRALIVVGSSSFRVVSDLSLATGNEGARKALSNSWMGDPTGAYRREAARSKYAASSRRKLRRNNCVSTSIWQRPQVLLRSHHSKFAENWALQPVTRASTPIEADYKAEFFGMQAQKQETPRHVPLELEPARLGPLFPAGNHSSFARAICRFTAGCSPLPWNKREANGRFPTIDKIKKSRRIRT